MRSRYPFLNNYEKKRPILSTPEATLVARFDDCKEILDRFDSFSVELYKPKQGSYWMAQDDTAQHWREKSIMKAVLDREQVPEIRKFIGKAAADILDTAPGEIEAVDGLSRAVPIALVQNWFGFVDADPKKMLEWSFWNQYDAFHNQSFDAIAVPDPALIEKNRKTAGFKMYLYLRKLVKRREGELDSGIINADVVTPPDKTVEIKCIKV